MNKSLTLSIMLILTSVTVTAQTYHEDDKEGLRIFLRQPSAEKGKINAERLGLEISDTLDWYKSEKWVKKIGISKRKYKHKRKWSRVKYLIWNEETPKRLDAIFWGGKRFAGALNANKWSELTFLYCNANQLTALDVSTNSKLVHLNCSDNLLTTLDVSTNTALFCLSCSHNLLTTLDVSANTKLRDLYYYNNNLLLSELFTISEKTNSHYKPLSSQTLPEQTVSLGKELVFSIPQNVFNGIYTEFTVTQNDNPVSENNYTITEGKITFNKTGVYIVKMTNEAIISNPNFPAEVVFEVRVVE